MLRSPEAPAPPAAKSPLIVLFSAARDWHARTLTAALKRRGCRVSVMPLERCAFETTAGEPSPGPRLTARATLPREGGGGAQGLQLGSLAGLPDGVIVRTVSAGSFEAVTRRLGILHALQRLGVPVWNEAAAIERCVDKSMTTFLLGQAGLPVPPSWAVEGSEAARAVVEREAADGPLVLKPLFGSQGRGLALVRSAADLPPAETVGDVYYLQRFVPGAGPGFRDFRVFVIDGRAITAMAREGTAWITNVKQGGRPRAARLDRDLAELAVAAARAVGARFCGVDLLRGADGALYVLEVNSMPAWSGLQTVTTVDIADALAAAFVQSLSALERKRGGRVLEGRRPAALVRGTRTLHDAAHGAKP